MGYQGAAAYEQHLNPDARRACCPQTDAPKRRTFRKFTFRGVDLEKLMDLDSTQIMDLMHSRVRRRFARGLKRKPMG
eukprot:COSAG01_NODE_29961_length_626_cov_0.842505_1_plen_76_part_10